MLLGCHLVTHERCAGQILHPCLPACFNERKVQEAFLRMFASLLYNYRSGFVSSADDAGGGDDLLYGQTHYFSKERFIKHSDRDSRVSQSLHVWRGLVIYAMTFFI